EVHEEVQTLVSLAWTVAGHERHDVVDALERPDGRLTCQDAVPRGVLREAAAEHIRTTLIEAPRIDVQALSDAHSKRRVLGYERCGCERQQPVGRALARDRHWIRRDWLHGSNLTPVGITVQTLG